MKYCISLKDIFFTLEAHNERDAKEKAKQRLIEKIKNSFIEIWPDYDGDECHRKYEHISEEDLKNINCTVG